MSGCATDRVVVTKIEYAVPPGQIFQPLPEVELKFGTNGEMLMSLIELHTHYRICAARMKAVIQFYENIQILNEGE